MNNIFSPYDFLKSRRPNKFSDSILVKKAKLNRDFFDFYLNSLTSRSQEKLFDTMGRFNRASIFAAKHGTDFQKKECSYQWAWSLYWWYEEFDDFINKYCEYEKNVIDTINFYDIERLTNLWMKIVT